MNTQNKQIWCVRYSHEYGVQQQKKFGPAPWGKRSSIIRITIIKSISKIFIPNFMCVHKLEDIKHIEQDFCSDAWVMPQGWDLGCWVVKNLSVGICDGLPSVLVYINIGSNQNFYLSCSIWYTASGRVDLSSSVSFLASFFQSGFGFAAISEARAWRTTVADILQHMLWKF